MIGYLNGRVHSITPPTILLDVQGVGYIVYTPIAVFYELEVGAPISLYIHDHIREDAHELYGFISSEDLDLFTLLISVSGVGPKTAIAALNVASSVHLRNAIINGDASLLQRVPGIGQKTAQRVVVDLRERLAKDFVGVPGTQLLYQEDQDVIDALVGLGYSVQSAHTVMGEMSAEVVGMQERLKTALKLLSNG
ncbi:MAG: Holliday junction branch migration protein RuvA [bacterium]|nr:Holliday junction branch migration protein RuvA [bacterium]